MNHSTPGGRILAIAAGIAFTGGALYILLEDVVVKGHVWTMAHALTVLAVFGTIASGHLSGEAIRARHFGAMFGFALLFFVGTGLTVYNSVGRQAEASETGVLSAGDRNAKRADARLAIARNQTMLDEERKKHAKECESGRGKRCDGIKASIAVYEDAVKGNVAMIKELGPDEPIAPKAEKMAEIIGLFGADKVQAKAALILLEPFLYTLFFEFGSIVAWGYAFRRRPAAIWQLSGNSGHLPTLGDSAQMSLPVPANDVELARLVAVAPSNPGNPGNGNGKHIYSRLKAERDLVTRLALGETVASQDELADRWGVSKGTVSKWVSAWERNLLIPARQQIGRCKKLAQA